MTTYSSANSTSATAQTDTVLIEKVRWSIRQRLRKQMKSLSADLFEAVDDFLFDSGQQGQIGESGNYLTAMRELRSKQLMFEEALLDQCMQTLKTSYRVGSDSVSLIAQINQNHRDDIEQAEVDLALQSMHRKTNKQYTQIFRQIDAIQQSTGFVDSAKIIDGRVLLESTLLAFKQAHLQVSLPLDIRIVFLKLFEQHFLMKMEKLFLDIVSILKNLHKKEFVEKLYSSSSSFKQNKEELSKEPQKQDSERKNDAIAQVDEPTVLVTEEGRQVAVEHMEKLEASISPAGEQILDQDDLDDLAKLLGGDEDIQQVSDNPPELAEMLPIIDGLEDETVVYLSINGKFEECLLHRSLSDKSSYTIRRSNGSLCLSRTRLGLALAICSGELRIDLSGVNATTNLATVIEPSGRVRH